MQGVPTSIAKHDAGKVERGHFFLQAGIRRMARLLPRVRSRMPISIRWRLAEWRDCPPHDSMIQAAVEEMEMKQLERGKPGRTWNRKGDGRL